MTSTLLVVRFCGSYSRGSHVSVCVSEMTSAWASSAGTKTRRTEAATIPASASAAMPPTAPTIMPSPQLDLQIQTCLLLFMHALLQPWLHRALIAPCSLLDQLVQPRRSQWDGRLGATGRPEAIIPRKALRQPSVYRSRHRRLADLDLREIYKV